MAPALTLREPLAADFAWVVERHRELYRREYGWDETFAALGERIVADFSLVRDPNRERGWIAELAGVRTGCVFCTRRAEETAQLRLLLVEPAYRGRGIGQLLVETCVDFACKAGYRSLELWTNNVLEDARRLYERNGFRLVDQRAFRGFAHELVEQTWPLCLR